MMMNLTSPYRDGKANKPTLGKCEANATPIEFRDALIALARHAVGERAAAELRRLHVQAAQDEALLRQALERLEAIVEHFDPYMGDNECRPMENARSTITALRERLVLAKENSND